MQGVELALLGLISVVVVALASYLKNFVPIFIVLLFGDYFAIQGEILLDLSALGAYKELLLTLTCFSFLVFAKQTAAARLVRLAIIVFLWFMLMASMDYRPFFGLSLAVVTGLLLADSEWKFRPNVALWAGVSAIICTWQFVYVSDISELWFFEFLSDRSGADFEGSLNAYFRNEVLRPPGFLVGPSTFGFVFILLNYLADKMNGRWPQRYVAKFACFSSLLMIQTRALLIIFIAYEVRKWLLPKARPAIIVSFYLLVFCLTLGATLMYGDDGALVRVFLFSSLISDLVSGGALLPTKSVYEGPVDSQVVAYVRLFGVLGIALLCVVIGSVYKRAKVQPGLTPELSFLMVLLFVNIFQWSDSSPGNLLGWMMVAFYVKQGAIRRVRRGGVIRLRARNSGTHEVA